MSRDPDRTPPRKGATTTDEAIRAALDIPPDVSSHDRTIDITTFGASSGKARRTEIWFHHVDGRWFLSGSPGRRDWYANLLGDPRMTVHLKHGVTADLPATGVPITEPDEKRRLVTLILRGLEQMGGWTTASAENIDAWTQGSPLVEIVFEAAPDGAALPGPSTPRCADPPSDGRRRS